MVVCWHDGVAFALLRLHSAGMGTCLSVRSLCVSGSTKPKNTIIFYLFN